MVPVFFSQKSLHPNGHRTPLAFKYDVQYTVLSSLIFFNIFSIYVKPFIIRRHYFKAAVSWSQKLLYKEEGGIGVNRATGIYYICKY